MVVVTKNAIKIETTEGMHEQFIAYLTKEESDWPERFLNLTGVFSASLYVRTWQFFMCPVRPGPQLVALTISNVFSGTTSDKCNVLFLVSV